MGLAILFGILLLFWVLGAGHYLGRDAVAAIGVVDVFLILVAHRIGCPLPAVGRQHAPAIFFVAFAAALVFAFHWEPPAQASAVAVIWTVTGGVVALVTRDRESNSLRREVLVAWAVGLVLLCCENLAFDAAIPRFGLGPDSQNYVLWARALQRALKGLPVDAFQYALYGMQSGGHATWNPQGDYSFADAIGTRHTLYSALLAGLFQLGMSINGIVLVQIGLISGGAAIWYAVAIRITRSRLIAGGMVVLSLLDTHAIAAGMTLWRGSTILFLLPILVLFSLRMLERRHFGWAMTGMVAAAVLMSVSRFHLLVLFCLILLGMAGLMSWRARSFRTIGVFAAVVTLVMIGSSIAYSPFNAPKGIARTFLLATAPIVNAGTTLTARLPADTARSLGQNTPVESWKREMEESPQQAWINAVSRSLFNPNPNWLRDSRGGPAAPFISVPEETLIYPGMSVFISMTPFFMLGVVLWRRTARPWPDMVLLLLLFFLIAFSYAVFFGSFSGRQRIQALPIYYLLSMHGLLMSPEFGRAVGRRIRAAVTTRAQPYDRPPSSPEVSSNRD